MLSVLKRTALMTKSFKSNSSVAAILDIVIWPIQKLPDDLLPKNISLMCQYETLYIPW